MLILTDNPTQLCSDPENVMDPDLISAIISNDLELTPEKIRSFLPLVNWDRLASMYLPDRSGAECETRYSLVLKEPPVFYFYWHPMPSLI